MKTIQFDVNNPLGKFKIMNATSGGPFHKRYTNDQFRSNYETYKAARIPYSRNHDSNVGSGIYGGPYAHDISAIFPNFDADENDPKNYIFENTDEAILTALETGTKTFFRLGQSIEHQIRKVNIFPPKDYEKWARICEHIIAHYTEGWANGFTHDMPYWEIWCEPDLDLDDSTNKRLWGGTKAEFFDFYTVVAKYLKSRFPHLKIGGPSLAFRENWAEEFLSEMQKRNVAIDFFSWHIYACEVEKIIKKSERIRSMLNKYGYEKTENILDEWNYNKGWTDEFLYSIESIHGIKGAAFMMAVMSMGQKSSIDMLMYYDTRPSPFNGVFDYYTLRPLKGYYAMKWYGEFYDYEKEIREINSTPNVYTLAGIDKAGKLMAVITHYNDNDEAKEITVKLDFGRKGKYEIYRLDAEHDGELIGVTEDLTFTMPVFTCIKIKEV